MEIKLGSQVEDLVSGFTGIATARIEYLNGCTQYCIAPRAVDNKIVENQYFDHAQLKVIAEGSVKVDPYDTGGPSRYCPK
jgi:hypothetical protein